MASTAVATRPSASPPAKAGSTSRALPAVVPQVQRWGPVTMATAVVVAGQAVLFATLVAAWLLSRSASPNWVTDEVHVDIYRGTTIVGTVLLAALMAQWAVSAARRDDGANTIIATAFSAGLGAAGAALAWFTMIDLGLGVGESLYSMLWYSLLGAFVGVAALTVAAQLVVLGWALSGHYSDTDHQPMTAVAMQWWLLLAVAGAYWLAIWVLR
jgi:heme/copper-type cytochrome/quinol oxidase subunit 3